MVASSHVPVAAALVAATRTGNLLLAAVIGMASHLVLDAIPHSDYYQFRRRGWDDPSAARERWEMPIIACDFLIAACMGIALSLLGHSWPILVAAFFSAAPDLVWEERVQKLMYKIPGVQWYTELPHKKLHRGVSHSARFFGIIPQLVALGLGIVSTILVLSTTASF